jgi:hypothetical protein
MLRSRTIELLKSQREKSHFCIFGLSVCIGIRVCLVLVCMCVGEVEFLFYLESHCCSKQPSMWINLFFYCTHSHATNKHRTHTRTRNEYMANFIKKRCSGMYEHTRTQAHTHHFAVASYQGCSPLSSQFRNLLCMKWTSRNLSFS